MPGTMDILLFEAPVFHRQVEGFSNVEYLIVFNAIIYGFITSMYFSGWGDIIRSRSQIKVHWEHLAWTIFSFLMFVANWYGAWHRVEFINDGIFYFFFSLIPLLLFYFISVVLFPVIREGKQIDLYEHLVKNKPAIFIIFAIYFFNTVVSGVVYKENDWIDEQQVMRYVGVALSVIAILFRNRVFHVAFLALGFFTLIRFFATLPAITD